MESIAGSLKPLAKLAELVLSNNTGIKGSLSQAPEAGVCLVKVMLLRAQPKGLECGGTCGGHKEACQLTRPSLASGRAQRCSSPRLLACAAPTIAGGTAWTGWGGL